MSEFNPMETVQLQRVDPSGAICQWNVTLMIDDDGHLNLYLTYGKNPYYSSSEIYEVENNQGDGDENDQLALRFIAKEIE